MSGNFGDKPFGLDDVKLVPIPVDTAVDLPVQQVLTFKERVKNAELEDGNGATVAVVASAAGVDWSLSEGGISLEAYALMTGRTLDSAGSTPNQTKTLSGDTPKNFPYFSIYGRSLGEGDDDLHILIPKAKLTSAMEGTFEAGKFFITKCSGIGVPDTNGNAYQFIQNETAAALDTDYGS
jgi:hypothetical protein